MGFVSAVGTFDVSLTHMTRTIIHAHVYNIIRVAPIYIYLYYLCTSLA